MYANLMDFHVPHPVSTYPDIIPEAYNPMHIGPFNNPPPWSKRTSNFGIHLSCRLVLIKVSTVIDVVFYSQPDPTRL